MPHVVRGAGEGRHGLAFGKRAVRLRDISVAQFDGDGNGAKPKLVRDGVGAAGEVDVDLGRAARDSGRDGVLHVDVESVARTVQGVRPVGARHSAATLWRNEDVVRVGCKCQRHKRDGETSCDSLHVVLLSFVVAC